MKFERPVCPGGWVKSMRIARLPNILFLNVWGFTVKDGYKMFLPDLMAHLIIVVIHLMILITYIRTVEYIFSYRQDVSKLSTFGDQHLSACCATYVSEIWHGWVNGVFLYADMSLYDSLQLGFNLTDISVITFHNVFEIWKANLLGQSV